MRLTYRLSCIVIRVLARLFFGLVVEGIEKVPKQGRLLIAANHQSYLDPPILGACLPREVSYFAKAQLFRRPILGAVIRYYNSIPVQRFGLDLKALRAASQVLNNEGGLILFPEGTRSRTGDFREGAGGVGMLAKQTDTPVLPVYIKGTKGCWRRIFRRGTIRLFFGDLIRFSDLSSVKGKSRDDYQAFSRLIMERIAALKAVNDVE